MICPKKTIPHYFWSILMCFLPVFSLTGQPASIEVADLALTIGGDKAEELYYAFAEGDQIVLTLTESTGKTLPDLTVLEYPQNVRFREMGATAIREKAIEVPATAVYVFRFQNFERKERVCRVNIRRIPGDAGERYFPTAVRWVEQYDTVVQTSVAQLENQRVRQTRQVLTSVDTSVVNLVERTERIHSRTHLSGKTSASIQVALPVNRATTGQSEEVVSWAYWIGVGQEAESQYKEANRLVRLAKTAAKTAADIGLIASGYGALAVLALEGVNFFVAPSNGDNVQYRLQINGQLIDQGNAVAAYARQDRIRQGEITLEMSNDNIIDALDVHVRMIAVVVRKTFREEEYFEERQVPLIDKKVVVRRVPVVNNR